MILASEFILAQNLALNRPYTLSVLPDYAYTAPSSNKTLLTDGIYTKPISGRNLGLLYGKDVS